MKKITFLLFSVLVAACALMPGIPGSVSVNKSDYDQATEVNMTPGWANNDMSGTLKLGARKTSRMATNEALLIVRNDSIKYFALTHPNLFIKVDGQETKLSPIDNKTECSVSTSTDVANCQQEYLVEISFLKKMIEAKDVKIKVNLTDNQYSEGSLFRTGMSTAKAGLQNFLAKIEKELVQRSTAASP